MNKLTNEEIAKVFLMYYNAEIINPRFKGTPLQYKNSMGRWFEASKYEQTKEEFWAERKLVLTPLFAITDEHAINLAELVNDEKYEITETFKVIKEDERISVYSSKVEHSGTPLGSYRYETRIYTDCYTTRIKPYSETRQIPYEAYQYLIQQGYAVPLFFGISHWANGKTAIELGIAERK